MTIQDILRPMLARVITGNTYKHKAALKAMGCKWRADMGAWIAPNATIGAKAQALVGRPAKAPYQGDRYSDI
jgi:hypothetical protein